MSAADQLTCRSTAKLLDFEMFAEVFANQSRELAETTIDALSAEAIRRWRLDEVTFWQRVRFHTRVIRANNIRSAEERGRAATMIEAQQIGADAADRRSNERHARVLLTGRVCGEDRDELCLVHDISPGGLMARFSRPRTVGEALCIELRGIPPIHGTVRWTDGLRAGVAFDASLDIELLFRHDAEASEKVRPLRFTVNAVASFDLGDTRVPLPLQDISVGGAKAATDRAFRRGQKGVFTLASPPWTMDATVCWTREGRVGLRFNRPMPLATLKALLEN